MLAELGYVSLIVALLASIYAIIVSVVGERQHKHHWVLSGRNAALFSFVLITISTVALEMALLREEYQITYVWSVSSPDMPLFFRTTALWGSQAGSLLFWSFTMALFGAASILLNWNSNRRLMPYVIAYIMAVQAFFLGLSIFLENPFTRYWLVNNEVVTAVFQPAGGVAPAYSRLAETAQGLNPLLRHFGMAIHPPMLYLGFVGFVIPFAFAMSALASGDLSTNWIKATRRWTLVAWMFLSLGLILGGRWAYDVLGWGGYWGWDPVENAAFLPWLTGTALLHSVMIQEKRGMLKLWNMFLIIGTFSAVIFGTFATRSGLVESVHSFARSGIGIPMFLFWSTLTVISVWLIMWRYNRGELKDEREFTSLWSRESLFVLNNIVFMALFIAVFWGSFGAPITSELFMDTDITLGVDYFHRVTIPMFAAMYILMGIAPLAAWGVGSLRRLGNAILIPLALALVSVVGIYFAGMTRIGALFGYFIVLLAGYVALYETYRAVVARTKRGESPLTAFITLMQRNPRRYGGYLIHLGVTVIGIGVIGSTVYQMETQRTLSVGESLTIGGYEMRYDRFDGGQISVDGRRMDIANVTVLRNGNEVTTLRPRRDFFPTGSEGMNTMTIAAAHSTWENDFYVLLVDWEPISQNSATFKVYVNPLINLVWWGSVILILGTLISTWPSEVVPERIRKNVHAGKKASATA